MGFRPLLKVTLMIISEIFLGYSGVNVESIELLSDTSFLKRVCIRFGSLSGVHFVS